MDTQQRSMRHFCSPDRYLSALAVGFMCCLASCTPSGLTKPHTVNSVQEAATIHIAPLAITRWEDYVTSLQPTFAITPAQALSLALPRTFFEQANSADLFSGSLQVGLPQSTSTEGLNKSITSGNTATGGASKSSGATSGSTTSNGSTTSTGNANNSTSTTSTVATNGGSTTTQTTTTQQGPGVLPPNLLPSATLPNASALTPATGTLATDPVLTYQAATAVYQEIQLLNNYVNDAVHQYGFVPYLARVQVSIAPMAHNEPYDVYVDLGLVSRCRGRLESRPVVLIPLLVTDDVETGQASTAVDNARQLALSLGAVTSNVALQAGLSQLKSEFQSILGTDFNSLYMVTRATDNVLQVRFGAARSTNTKVQYTMLTQTHDVSFLMLVDENDAARPKDPRNPDDPNNCSNFWPERGAFREAWDEGGPNRRGPQIWINGYTRIRNAVDGTQLPIDRQIIQDRAVEIVHRFQRSDQQTPFSYNDGVGQLITDVGQNSTEAFRKDLCSLLTPGYQAMSPDEKFKACLNFGWGTAASAWTALASIVDMSEFSGTYFNLPYLRTPMFDKNQALYLHDDCKSAATVTIAGSTQIAPSQFTARLWLSNNVVLSAISITQPTVGGGFTVKFPTLYPFRGVTNELGEENATKLGLACPSKEAQTASQAASKAADAAASAAASKQAAATAAATAATKAEKDAETKQASPADLAAAKAKASAAQTAAKEASAKAAVELKAASAAKEAATTPAPLTHLQNVGLVLSRMGDDRWPSPEEDHSAFYGNVFYDAAASQLNTTLSLVPAADTITAAPNATTPAAGSTGVVRLFLVAGKDLSDILVTFAGGSLATVPTLASGGTYLQAAETQQTPAQIPATLKITPPNGVTFDPSTPIVFDVNLQGLVATRNLTVTASGRDPNKAVLSSATAVVAVTAAATPGGSTPNGATSK